MNDWFSENVFSDSLLRYSQSYLDSDPIVSVEEKGSSSIKKTLSPSRMLSLYLSLQLSKIRVACAKAIGKSVQKELKKGREEHRKLEIQKKILFAEMLRRELEKRFVIG